MTSLPPNTPIELPNFFEFCNLINFDTTSSIVVNADGTLTLRNDFVDLQHITNDQVCKVLGFEDPTGA